MHICFRVDASKDIGTGHLIRCFTLAEALLERGARVTFLCRHLPEEYQDRFQTLKMDCVILNLEDKVETDDVSNPYLKWLGSSIQEDAKDCATAINQLASPVDWLIVDHYALDSEWERLLRPFCKQIMVIDDLNRSHNCELLLDQNLSGESETPYRGLVPAGCLTLLGPAYALLKPQFAEARQGLDPRGGSLNRILIFFGGTDPGNCTMKALNAINTLNLDIDLDIVTGVFYPYLEELKALCEGDKSITIHQNADMAQLMSKADLSLGNPGSTTWERMALGLPAIVVVSAENQLRVAQEAHKRGALINLGNENKVDQSDWIKTIDELHRNPENLRKMSQKGMDLVDGRGTRRVADILTLTKSAYS